LIVRLPKGGRVFRSEVGVDARAGGGSVEAIVRVGGKELYHSELLHVDTPARGVEVELGGAKEFTLEVTDGGDGISSDQTDWADARVVLEDGTEWRLGDQPIDGGARGVYSSEAPFSFVYGGKGSRELLPKWRVEREVKDKGSSWLHRAVYTDPETGLVVRCEGVEWRDFPVVEWTVYMKNGGTKDTPMIEGVRGVDMVLPGAAGDEPVLHDNTGDLCTADSYEPHAVAMPVGYHQAIAATGGRPTQNVFPYFNFAQTAGSGVVMALGWPGEWSADISRDAGGSLHLVGGQEVTHLVLHPGEEIRSPRVILGFYQGDWIRGQNLWRRWMVAHNMPEVKPGAWLCTGNYYPGLMSNAKQEIAFLKEYLDAGIGFDAWWQDAGWYPCDGVTWPKTGTWEVDKGRFPKGLREVSDYVHSRGMKSIVWFEPERVYAGTWLAETHPEWIHGGKAGGLLDMGNVAARSWLTDHIDQLMTDQGIDVYRQDFNIDPLAYWRGADAADRQGMTENKHIEGYLAYWDELLKRKAGRWIDSCSSGGRRNDAETMARAVPLLRSDWYNSADGQQCQTYGLSMWFPYQGTGAVGGRDEYWYRSSMVAGFTIGPDGSGAAGMDLKLVKRMVEEHRGMGDAFLGDYYPLTGYSLGRDVWMAWQYDRPEEGYGVVQAFRREECVYESARLRLRGIEAGEDYVVTDLGSGKTSVHHGRELLDEGLLIVIGDRPGSVMMTYRRVKR
jgi:alpha-galactosidase